MKKVYFKDVAIKWLNYHKMLVKESTFASYSIIMDNYLIPLMGKYNINEIDNDVIQNLVIYLLEKGKKEPNIGLGENTVKNIISVLKICLKYAHKLGYRNVYILDIVYPKRNTDKRVKVLEKNNHQRLIKCIYKNMNYKNIGILLALNTGMRIGEICAIQWKDIDLKNNTINVTKTIQRLFLKDDYGRTYTKVIITSPKSSTSIREIPLSNELIRILKKYKVKNQEAYLLTGSEKHMEPRTYRSYYNRFLKRNKIEHIKFHSLRHTFATRCIQAGGDYKAVSEILGHATINMTLNLYVHPQMEEKRKCVELINTI